jgi:hypothetical protein
MGNLSRWDASLDNEETRNFIQAQLDWAWWSEGKTIAHELMWKSGLPLPGLSSSSHWPCSKLARWLFLILLGMVPLLPAGTRGRRPRRLERGTIHTSGRGLGRYSILVPMWAVLGHHRLDCPGQ